MTIYDPAVRSELIDAARGAIERGLDITEHPAYDERNPDVALNDADWIFSVSYDIAIEALSEQGTYSIEDVREIARQAAQEVAQP